MVTTDCPIINSLVNQKEILVPNALHESMLEGLRSIGRVPRERWISPPGIVNLPRRFRNGVTVTATSAALSFDLAEATKYLAHRDECLQRLIDETLPLPIAVAYAQSPYESLLE